MDYQLSSWYFVNDEVKAFSELFRLFAAFEYGLVDRWSSAVFQISDNFEWSNVRLQSNLILAGFELHIRCISLSEFMRKQYQICWFSTKYQFSYTRVFGSWLQWDIVSRYEIYFKDALSRFLGHTTKQHHPTSKPRKLCNQQKCAVIF